MLTKEEAREIVTQALIEARDSDFPILVGGILVVLDEYTFECEVGWVFFYNSLMYHETGDYLYRILGKPFILIAKIDGSVHEPSLRYLTVDEYSECLHRHKKIDAAINTERHSCPDDDRP